MIKKLNHIGIAVKSLSEQIPFYRDILKLPFVSSEEISEQKVKVAIFQVGEVRIELLEPTSVESPIAKFIEKKGEGLHHLAYESDDIHEELSGFKQQGLALIDEEPRKGVHGALIAFLHPSSSARVLTEICQMPTE